MTEQATGGNNGRLADNIMHFGRVLRSAGLPVGPGAVLDAIEAVTTAGISSRKDFYWILHAVFVSRRGEREVFDQAFHIFWRNPEILKRMIGMLLPTVRGPEAEQYKAALSRRVDEALAGGRKNGAASEPDEEPEFDAAFTFSTREVLAKKDFEAMSSEEYSRARKAIRNLTLPLRDVPTRRFKPDRSGNRIDMRATLRAVARFGGDIVELKRRSRRRRPPPLVVLCDVSGSMDRYSRILLHFLHALTNDRDRVHSFVFGTRLSNITRHLRNKDPDTAIDRISDAVEDWAGGTRIGQTLHRFNRDWSRRVLGQGALVLLVTDGLDRDGAAGIEVEMERLHKSCRRLIWLNPLLRYDRYAPKAAGARAMIAHVDDFRPVHNLESLEELAMALDVDFRAPRRPVKRLAA